MSNLDAKFSGEIFRKDFPIIFANLKNAGILPVRVLYDSAGYEVGRVLGRITSSGYYAKYDDGDSPAGVGVAKGVMLDEIAATEFPSATGTLVARMITSGYLYNDNLVGLDSNAVTDLNARTVVDGTGTTILIF